MANPTPSAFFSGAAPTISSSIAPIGIGSGIVSSMPSSPTSGMSLLNMANLVSTGAMAFTQLAGFQMQRDLGRFQMQQLKFQSDAQQLKARQDALALRKSAMQNAARARALFAGRGVARTGSAAQAIEQSFINAERDIVRSKRSAEIKSAQLEGAGKQARAQSNVMAINNLINAGQSISQGILTQFS